MLDARKEGAYAGVGVPGEYGEGGVRRAYGESGVRGNVGVRGVYANDADTGVRTSAIGERNGGAIGEPEPEPSAAGSEARYGNCASSGDHGEMRASARGGGGSHTSSFDQFE